MIVIVVNDKYHCITLYKPSSYIGVEYVRFEKFSQSCMWSESELIKSIMIVWKSAKNVKSFKSAYTYLYIDGSRRGHLVQISCQSNGFVQFRAVLILMD